MESKALFAKHPFAHELFVGEWHSFADELLAQTIAILSKQIMVPLHDGRMLPGLAQRAVDANTLAERPTVVESETALLVEDERVGRPQLLIQIWCVLSHSSFSVLSFRVPTADQRAASSTRWSTASSKMKSRSAWITSLGRVDNHVAAAGLCLGRTNIRQMRQPFTTGSTSCQTLSVMHAACKNSESWAVGC